MRGPGKAIRILVGFFLFGCGMDPHVIGDDTAASEQGAASGNASVRILAVMEDGLSASGARVELWPLDSTSDRPVAQATTDGRGEAIVAVSAGEWSVVVQKEGMAFQGRVRDGGRIQDTLRRMASLVGIVSGGGGQEVSILGQGARTRCDTNGFFRLDSLAAGHHPVLVGAGAGRERSLVSVEAGRRNMVLGKKGVLPADWPSLPTDSLIAWGDPTSTLRLPRGSLGFQGDFAVAVRFRRPDTTSPLQVFSWTDGLSQGVKIGWRGADTVLLTVDGRTLVGIGVRLDTGSRQVGFSWQQGTFALVVDSDSVASFSYPTAAARGEWSVPTIGAQGVRLDWVAFQRGGVEEDWLVRLSGL